MESGGAARGSGLDGVVAAETRLSEVDGERGRLILAGRDVEALAGEGGASFEGACALLWRAAEGAEEAEAGEAVRADAVRGALGAGRVAAFARRDRLGDALSARDGMDALRAAVAHLPSDASPAAVAGAVATFAAAWARTRAGEAPVPPDASLPHAVDCLRMARGEAPSEAEARALDAYLVTVSDHGMNASTFAARVVTSTGSDRVSAVVAAIGALKGPLHGGAPGPVLDMLDAVSAAEGDGAGEGGAGAEGGAARWIEAELGAGRRIMGMGHRVYRVRDPRAAVLERAVERLSRAASGQRGARLSVARAVERAAEAALQERHPERALRANVEFYTAVLLEAVGLSRAMFSPTFAVGRVAGWCAHIEEQRRTGRLIRPASRYVGARPAPRAA